jgi:crotonobetainyl-CoA:carnitine CoA-transferase CaiB-like acyl-CoA transferase
LPPRLALSRAAKIASDLGARIGKSEPPGGDPIGRLPIRHWERGPEDAKALFAFLNTAKESVVTRFFLSYPRW